MLNVKDDSRLPMNCDMKVCYSFGAKFEEFYGQVTLMAMKGLNCVVLHIRIDNATIYHSRKIFVNYVML